MIVSLTEFNRSNVVSELLTSNRALAVVIELVLDESEHQTRLADSRLAKQDELELKHSGIPLGGHVVCE